MFCHASTVTVAFRDPLVFSGLVAYANSARYVVACLFFFGHFSSVPAAFWVHSSPWVQASRFFFSLAFFFSFCEAAGSDGGMAGW